MSDNDLNDRYDRGRSRRPEAGQVWTAAPRGEPLLVEGVAIREIFGVLRRRAWLILAVAAILSTVVALSLSRQYPVYRATALVLIADARQNLTGRIAAEAPERSVGRWTDPILSQIEVVQGRTVIGRVIDREGLRLVSGSPSFPMHMLSDVRVAPDAEPDSLNLRFLADAVAVRTLSGEARVPYGSSVELQGVRFTIARPPETAHATLHVLQREVAIDGVAGGLHAAPRQGTDVIQITFTGGDPDRARRIVNALAEEYQAYNVEMAQQQSRRRRIFLEEQLLNTEALLSEAQFALTSFRTRRQVYSSREQIAVQQQALHSVDMRREELVADHQVYESLLSGLLGAGEQDRDIAIRALVSSPGIAANPVITQVYGQLVQYVAQRDGLTSGPQASTASNPDVERLNALIATTRTRLVESVRSHVASLESRIAALDGLRLRNFSELQRLPDAEAEESRLTQQVASASRMADEIRTDLQRARIAEAVEAGQVEIIQLSPSANRVPLGRAKKVALALVLGLMLGCGGAFAAEATNTSIRRQKDLDAVLHVPSLATIPRVDFGTVESRRPWLAARIRQLGDGRESPSRTSAAALLDGRSPGAEAYRRLRNNLLFSEVGDPLRTLVVTSATPGEGKTVTAANLAAAYARQGKRVLLVDCDAHRARIHRIFDFSREPGLSELLTGDCDVTEAIRATPMENLFVLPAGRYSEGGTELLQGEPLRKMIRLLASGFDLLIIDSPPVLATADAVALGTAADGVLFVLRAGRTDRSVAEQAVRELVLAGARPIGSVLNDPEEQLLDGLYPAYYSYVGAV